MLAIATIMAWYLLDFNLMWRKIKLDSSILMLGFVIFGLLGARLLQIVLFWDYYRDNLAEIPMVWKGGLASYGAYFLGIGWLIWYIRNYKEQKKDILDAAVPAMLLGLGLARFGCFLIDDHLGKPTDLPWAIWSMDALRHPISLYYSLSILLMFGLFSLWFYQQKFRGKLLWITLIMYGVLRVFLDVFFKDFEGRSINWSATLGASVIFVVIGLLMLVLTKNKKDVVNN